MKIRSIMPVAMVWASLGATSVAWGQGGASRCDPLAIRDVIPVKSMQRVEVLRSNTPFWIDLDLEVNRATTNPRYISANGDVLASTLRFQIDGMECPALISAVQAYTNKGWQNLRLAGENEYGSAYFGEYFTVRRVRVGLNLMLLQKAYCDVNVQSVIYEPKPPFMRPGLPDPGC